MCLTNRNANRVYFYPNKDAFIHHNFHCANRLFILCKNSLTKMAKDLEAYYVGGNPLMLGDKEHAAYPDED